MSPRDKAARLRLMAFDVDGVLTDGRLYYSPRGDELKAFSTMDGHGLRMLMESGITVAIITGRESAIVAQRAANLGIDRVFQGIKDKRAAMAGLLATEGLTAEQAGYMGDDVVDLPVLRACGFSATVGDGHPFVREHVDFVAQGVGGHGGVRELCEFILDAQGKLQPLLARYLS